MNKLMLFLCLLVFSIILKAEELPGGHMLKKNSNEEYFVINKKKVVMIEPAIIKLGFNRNWILACIKNKSIDSDLKRWVFINIKNGGTFDSINQENWQYFNNEAYPELQTIKVKAYSDEACP